MRGEKMDKKIIVIGGVAAGTRAASKAKREDPTCSVTIITNEEYISYSGCGLPYFIGKVVPSSEQLIVRTPQEFKHNQGIDVLTRHLVYDIDPINKKVYVKDLTENKEKVMDYDKLIIATGASPIKPKIEGFNLKRIFVLRSISDALNIRELLDENKVVKPLIVGGGFIGLEVLESLFERGLQPTVIEATNQILPGYDIEIAKLLEKYLVKEKEIKIITERRIIRFLGNERGEVNAVELDDGNIINTDLVVWSAGVRPNVEIAKKAGIEIGNTGAIKADKYMRTNIPDIFAAGDCCETTHLVCNKPVWIPMGSTANKMGRVAGHNVVTDNEKYYESFEGILGTNILKIFNYTVAKTGLSEKQAKEEGFNLESVIVPSNDKAHYYPTSKIIIIKLIADKNTGRILGAQAMGEGVIDKPMDIIASFIHLKGKVEELSKIDLAYSPPYSMALSSVIVTANVLKNKLKGKLKGINPRELYERLKKENLTIVDVRSEYEFMTLSIPGSINIPLNEILEKAHILDKRKEIILVCGIGLRSYQAYTRLKALGFKNIKILDGGLKAYPYL